MGRVRNALLVVACLLAAGCVGVPNGGSTDPFASLSGGPSGSTGCLRGVVVDEAIRPIPNVNLTLQPVNKAGRSDAQGVFQFCDLQPGVYFVHGTHPDYLTAQSSGQSVEANGIAAVRLVLALNTDPKPYHVTYPFHGFMQAWLGIAQFFGESSGRNGTGLCNCREYVTPDPNVKTFVFEAKWQDSVPPPPGDPLGFAEYYYVVTQSDGRGMDHEDYCYSPCLAHIDAQSAGYEQGKEVYFRLDGPDTWVVYQQPIDIYLTVFYNQPAAKQWSFLSGSS